MNKLKEINGKFYQEAEVVMLATDNKTSVINLENDDELLHINQYVPKLEYGNQHLYFLSNEEIKDERILYCNLEKQIIDYRDQPASPKSILGYSYMRYCKKIIATTDLSLNINNYLDVDRLIDFEYNLPQPSQSFIQAFIKSYNEGKPITKVLVEMEEYATETTYNLGIDCSIPLFKLKVNSSNEITIKKIKDSYTREEVVELCKSAFITGTRENDIDYFEWERRNL